MSTLKTDSAENALLRWIEEYGVDSPKTHPSWAGCVLTAPALVQGRKQMIAVAARFNRHTNGYGCDLQARSATALDGETHVKVTPPDILSLAIQRSLANSTLRARLTDVIVPHHIRGIGVAKVSFGLLWIYALTPEQRKMGVVFSGKLIDERPNQDADANIRRDRLYKRLLNFSNGTYATDKDGNGHFEGVLIDDPFRTLGPGDVRPYQLVRSQDLHSTLTPPQAQAESPDLHEDGDGQGMR